jgi:hypothetical protein
MVQATAQGGTPRVEGDGISLEHLEDNGRFLTVLCSLFSIRGQQSFLTVLCSLFSI